MLFTLKLLFVAFILLLLEAVYSEHIQKRIFSFASYKCKLRSGLNGFVKQNLDTVNINPISINVLFCWWPETSFTLSGVVEPLQGNSITQSPSGSLCQFCRESNVRHCFQSFSFMKDGSPESVLVQFFIICAINIFS